MSSAYPLVQPAHDFHVNQRLDARDGHGKWLPAQIVQIEDRGTGRRGGRDSPFQGDWENDEHGGWQPRGGKTIKVHFEGFDSKWDEWIHTACFVDEANLFAHSDSSPLRARLAPLGLFSNRTQPSGRRAGDIVEVEVAVPIEPAPNDRRPRFNIAWLTARVVSIDGAQVEIRYEPPMSSPSFRFPQWFHEGLKEIKRLGSPAPKKNQPSTPGVRKSLNLLLSHRTADDDDSTISRSHSTSRTTPTIRPPNSVAVTPKATPFGAKRTPTHSTPPATSSFFSSLSNLSLLPSSSSSSSPLSVGKLVDVRSIEDGLWHEARIIKVASDREITVQYVDRQTTQDVLLIDQQYLLASHRQFSTGEVSPRYDLDDHINVTIHSDSEYQLSGVIKRFKQGQMLVRLDNSQEQYWVNPKCDHVTFAPGYVKKKSSIPSPVQTPITPAHQFNATTVGDDDHVRLRATIPDKESTGFLSRIFSFNNTESSPTPTPTSLASSATANGITHVVPSPTSSMHSLPSPLSSPMNMLLQSQSPALVDVEENTRRYQMILSRSAQCSLRAPVGIINVHNSCYIGCVLQILAGLQPLIQYFVLDRRHENILAARRAEATGLTRQTVDQQRLQPLQEGFGKVTMQFAKILTMLYTGSNGAHVFPDDLKQAVVQYGGESGKRFRGHHMQDAHEFLAVLLDLVHSELNTGIRAHRSSEEQKSQKGEEVAVDPIIEAQKHWRQFQTANTDIISYLFYCQSIQYVVCSACGHHSRSHHIAGQLTLDIPHSSSSSSSSYDDGDLSLKRFNHRSSNGLSARHYPPRPSSPSHAVTLNECLMTQVTVASIDDYYCTRCRSKHLAHSGMYYTSLPPVLLIQLKRFDTVIDPSSGDLMNGAKDETPCQYPIELDVQHLMRPSKELMKYIQPPIVTQHDGQTLESRYKLVGVVLHNAEHYTAFTRAQPQPQSNRFDSNPIWSDDETDTDTRQPHHWYFFNDSKYRREKEETVSSRQKDVYLLMYQRIEH